MSFLNKINQQRTITAKVMMNTKERFCGKFIPIIEKSNYQELSAMLRVQ